VLFFIACEVRHMIASPGSKNLSRRTFMNHPSVPVCDCCGATQPLTQQGFCAPCSEQQLAFEALVDNITAFAEQLNAAGYTTAEVLGALESASEIFEADHPESRPSRN
jgi:hypothetical protein